RNCIDARLVCHIGRSNGFSPDPIVLLRNPGFPHRGFCRFSDARRSPPYRRGGSRKRGNRPGVAGPARVAASAWTNLSLDRHARISGDNIGRSREINFRDSRPWAAGLPILEIDPVASEAVEVLLSLAEVL